MTAAPLKEPKEVTVEDKFGNKVTVLISKIPAIPCRELLAKYPLSAMPKIGDYPVNEEAMRKLMTYVAKPLEAGDPIRLTTDALINQHIPSGELLLKVEWATMEYNVSFFAHGLSSSFLDNIKAKAHLLTMKILTDLSAASSAQGKRRSKN